MKRSRHLKTGSVGFEKLNLMCGHIPERTKLEENYENHSLFSFL